METMSIDKNKIVNVKYISHRGMLCALEGGWAKGAVSWGKGPGCQAPLIRHQEC